MQKQPDAIDRKMVPRWRSLALTPPAELLSTNRKHAVRSIVDHDDTRTRWIQERTPWTAAELLSISVFIGQNDAADEAAAYLVDCKDGIAPGVRSLLNSYLNSETPTEESGALPQERQLRYQAIADLRRLSNFYPRDPISHVDIARIQLSLGQPRAAQRALTTALKLAPENRYVLRSAVRFFVHEGDFDRAWHVIRNAPKSDPWLLAPAIAAGDLANKDQPNTRTVQNVLESTSSSQGTELAASFATLELGAGKFKRARKLFSLSSEDPTENSVAQLRWANEKTGIPFDGKLLEISRSFEARTGQFMVDKNWAEAAECAVQWLADEPFSGRASGTGCFLFAELLHQFDRAESIIDLALMSTPNSPILLNNRAFIRANLGKIDLAIKDVQLARTHNPAPSVALCLSATEGCILYRQGQHEAGELKYGEAIDGAIKLGEQSTAHRALIHYIEEEGRIGKRLDPLASEKIVKFFETDANVREMDREIFRTHAKSYIVESPMEKFMANIGKMAADILASSKKL